MSKADKIKAINDNGGIVVIVRIVEEVEEILNNIDRGIYEKK